MMRSLWTAASGMNAQQFNIDTISNNLSNVNTTGFKEVRADFEDLLYQNSRIAGTPATRDTVVPTGIQVGHGVKVAATQRMFTQGSIKQTDNDADMAITGEGFFKIQQLDGTDGFTRNGAFKIDVNGQFVTANGNKMQPEIILPEGFIRNSLSVSVDGRVTVKVPGNNDTLDVGQMEVFRFVNPAGLQAVGGNTYKITNASGESIGGRPGFDGMGELRHKFLETSNVSTVKEMVNMIVAQRAYELNSKAIQTSDSMLGIANNLKR